MPADAVEGFYVPADDGEPYPFGGGGVATFKVRGEDTGGHFEITENTLPPGHPGTPPHIHNSLDHAWYVLEGVVDFQVGDRIVHAGRGACVFAPKGMAHRFSNPGTEPGKWLQIDSVGGREAMFKEMAERLPNDAPPDPAVLLEIFAKYDTCPAL
jgi:mannose-6-phosphate isomerase-like protein (cupin superfamily)